MIHPWGAFRRRGITHRIALLRLGASDATANLWTGVRLGLAPGLLRIVGNRACIDTAALADARWQHARVVLGYNEARESRRGNEES